MKVIRTAALALVVFGFLLGFIELVRFGAAWDLKQLEGYEVHWSHVIAMVAFVSLGLLIYEHGKVREALTTFTTLGPKLIPLVQSIRIGGRRTTDPPPPTERQESDV